jgi:hypothetical protein
MHPGPSPFPPFHSYLQPENKMFLDNRPHVEAKILPAKVGVDASYNDPNIRQ